MLRTLQQNINSLASIIVDITNISLKEELDDTNLFP